MTLKMTAYKQNLIKLCMDFIDILETLKAKGVITDEEYNKHISLKRNFIKNNMN